jgi:hypothetical protein
MIASLSAFSLRRSGVLGGIPHCLHTAMQDLEISLGKIYLHIDHRETVFLLIAGLIALLREGVTDDQTT